MSAYELRIYQIAPGKMDATQGVMRDIMAPLMREYAMDGFGFWATPDDATFIGLCV